MARALPTLEVENLGKRYRLGRMTPRESIARVMGFARTSRPENHHWALRGVSFTLNRGDVLGVVGANGAGKSTLLKLMSRITRPTEGRAVIRGRVGSLLEVGTGFHPELTGMENVYINGAILGMTRKEIRARLADILEFAGIGRYIDTPVKRYSSGMYTRLAFAIAAHLEPEVLIVDEVLAVGDAEFQKRCLQKMQDAAELGRTILFVSHGAANVEKLCNKALLLEAGVPTAAGDVQQVLAAYAPPPPPVEQVTPRTDVPPPVRSSAARAITIETRDADGHPAGRFAVGAPWSVEIDLEILAPVSAFVAGVGLTAGDQIPVCTAWTAPHPVTPGRYRARFDMEPVFKAATLHLTVGLTGDDETLHQAPGVTHVEIGPDLSGDAVNLPHPTSASGMVIHRGHSELIRSAVSHPERAVP